MIILFWNAHASYKMWTNVNRKTFSVIILRFTFYLGGRLVKNIQDLSLLLFTVNHSGKIKSPTYGKKSEIITISLFGWCQVPWSKYREDPRFLRWMSWPCQCKIILYFVILRQIYWRLNAYNLNSIIRIDKAGRKFPFEIEKTAY